ncbi:uncharacterized protein JCM10292_000438 [Rhodotorula paludigena]|uniref:uncharacterized protein n=1 Tax=Rhodotorula paludigena TaxID=86838 RepID=UPI00317A1592
MSAAPFALPGYVWDGARFYKAPASPARHTPASALRTASSAAAPHDRPESAGKKRKRARKAAQKGKGKLADSHPRADLANLGLGHWHSPARRDQLHHELRRASLERLSSVRTLYPDCIPVDDTILHLSFDDTAPATLRAGTSSGTIATGTLSRPPDELAWYPNDEEGWRTSWYCSSKVTSVKTCGNRFVATSLGPPAQAIVGTTSDSISLASVTLSPRKTSLWTSAISPSLLALGCDRKVLLSSDPTRAQMDAYVTGGNRGDGTVFALDLDRTQLHLSSPVTHVRHIKDQPHQLLAAGMDGFLGVFDLRFLPTPSAPARHLSETRSRPVVELKGHVNSFTVDLGLDVWRDEWVVAAGQDKRIRLWSLRTGRLVRPSSPASPSSWSSTFTSTALPAALAYSVPVPPAANPTHPLERTSPAPIHALAFSPLDPLRLREPRYASALAAGAAQRGEGVGVDEGARRARWGVPSLWVAEGAGVECFAVV